jgi:hypothetical protein
MTARRSRFINACIGFIVLASTYDIVLDEEHWPFSQYPMFNRVTESRELTWLRVYAVTPDGVEFPLVGYREVFPFDQSRLSKVFGSIRTRENAPSEMRRALADCLERYERLRQLGWHEGPPAARLRLYEVRWTLDPAAANVDAPDSRTFLAESPL